MATIAEKVKERGNAKLGYGGIPIGKAKEVTTTSTTANPEYRAAKTYMVDDDSDIAKQENQQGGYSQRNIDKSIMGNTDRARFEDQYGFDPGDTKNQGKNSRLRFGNTAFSTTRASNASNARRAEKAESGEIDTSQGSSIGTLRAKQQQSREQQGRGGEIDTSQGVSTGVNRAKNQQARERNANRFTEGEEMRRGGQTRGNADTRDTSQGQSVGELQRAHQESQGGGKGEGSNEEKTGVNNPFVSHTSSEIQANAKKRSELAQDRSNDYYAGGEEQRNSILNDLSGHDTFPFGGKKPEPENEVVGATPEERSKNVLRKLTSTSTFPLGTGGNGGDIDISAGMYGR